MPVFGVSRVEGFEDTVILAELFHMDLRFIFDSASF